MREGDSDTTGRPVNIPIFPISNFGESNSKKESRSESRWGTIYKARETMSREPEIKVLEVEADFDVDTQIVIDHLVSSLMKAIQNAHPGLHPILHEHALQTPPEPQTCSIEPIKMPLQNPLAHRRWCPRLPRRSTRIGSFGLARRRGRGRRGG